MIHSPPTSKPKKGSRSLRCQVSINNENKNPF